ncbi:MAG: hypothetical protein JW871_00165 [Endomicrobiales bacterium]|nr:hypothetical protein [Endomicrobiales bacterium]
MKVKLPLLILCLAILTVLPFSMDATGASKTEVFYLSDFLPQISDSFEDLDARDENNQPIENQNAIIELQMLFRSGLYNLLLYSEIHSISRSLEIIKKKLSLAAFAFTKRWRYIVNRCISCLAPNTKQKWDKALICLLGFLAFKISFLNFFLFNLKFSLLRRKTAPQTLRL